MYIDTHAHLNMPIFSDLKEVLDRAKKSDIDFIVNASFDLNSSFEGVSLASKFDFIYAAIGIHPHDADKLNHDVLNNLIKLSSDKKVVAIGETGLDYFKCKVPPEGQKESFKRQLLLAKNLDLPVIVHCRDAASDVIEIMSNDLYSGVKSVFHCFAGDSNLLNFGVERGDFFSFAGNLTFKKSDSLRDAAIKIPINRIMLETDCPYLAPEPMRGQRCEPSFVVHVAKTISELKKISIEEVAQITSSNAQNFFKI